MNNVVFLKVGECDDSGFEIDENLVHCWIFDLRDELNVPLQKDHNGSILVNVQNYAYEVMAVLGRDWYDITMSPLRSLVADSSYVRFDVNL